MKLARMRGHEDFLAEGITMVVKHCRLSETELEDLRIAQSWTAPSFASPHALPCAARHQRRMPDNELCRALVGAADVPGKGRLAPVGCALLQGRTQIWFSFAFGMLSPYMVALLPIAALERGPLAAPTAG